MRVLVPISDDPASEDAIAEALRFTADGGEIILASVGELPEVPEQEREAKRALQARLSEVAGRVSGPTVRTRIELAGDPVRGIVQVAREENVDRIVMVSSEKGVLEALVDGSVADDVLEAIEDIPVTVVRKGSRSG
jgi:nucleotide-binding universal stress UspA family protein